MQQSSLMVLECQWKPASVSFGTSQRLPTLMTPNIAISSKIKVRNEEVFRVCLKQPAYGGSVYVLIVCSNLNKIGIMVEGVDLKVENTKKRMLLQSDRQSGIQIFSYEFGNQRLISLREYITEKITFLIYVAGCLPEYRFQLRDQLLKTQLWLAAQEQQMTDVTFAVDNGKNLYAHKFILAARSPVFAQKFLNSTSTSSKSELINMEYIAASTVEQFLKFIYTGELEAQPNKQLLTLAKAYGVQTLVDLSNCCSQEVSDDDVVDLIALLHSPSLRSTSQRALPSFM